MEAQTAEKEKIETTNKRDSLLKRILFIFLGFLFIGLGIIGIPIPVLPTTLVSLVGRYQVLAASCISVMTSNIPDFQGQKRFRQLPVEQGNRLNYLRIQ